MHREPYILIDAKPKPQSGTVTVSGDEAHHLRKVMRAKIGDTFIAFDGGGHGWRVEIDAIDNKRVTAKIIKLIPTETLNSELTISVAVGIIKGNRMDWAVEKAAELGAACFLPLKTQYSVVTPGENRLKRWNSVALSAAKQSHNFTLMQVEPDHSIEHVIKNSGASRLCALDVGSGSVTLKSVWDGCNAEQISDLMLFIGPEGGFSPVELNLFADHNIPIVTLGDRPLRTETAVAVALGTLNSFSLRLCHT